jgi:hypothetical protein
MQLYLSTSMHSWHEQVQLHHCTFAYVLIKLCLHFYLYFPVVILLMARNCCQQEKDMRCSYQLV